MIGRRVAMTLVAVAALAGASGDAAAGRRRTHCCVMVPDDGGGERPYCFILNVRPAGYGRTLCRLIGGRLQRRPMR